MTNEYFWMGKPIEKLSRAFILIADQLRELQSPERLRALSVEKAECVARS